MVKKKEPQVEKLDKKQVVVSIIILFAAILTLSYAFWEMKPKKLSSENVTANKVEPIQTNSVIARVIENVAVKDAMLPNPVESNNSVATENVEAEPVQEENHVQEDVAEETPTEPEESATLETPESSEASAEEPATEENVVENEPSQEDILKMAPKKVVVTFVANLEKDVNLQVYYTKNEGEEFTEMMSVRQDATAGTNRYNIVLPVEHIYRFRLDFGEYPGKVMVKGIKLLGSQEADLNDFNQYNTNALEDIAINEDGSMSFTSEAYDPYMIYQTQL